MRKGILLMPSLVFLVMSCCQAPEHQSVFQKALRNRALLGQISHEGEVLSQVVRLYDSPEFTGNNFFVVLCGTEGRILEVTDRETCRVEVPAERIVSPENVKTQGGLKEGWLRCAEVKSLFEIMTTLSTQRKNSDVVCELNCSAKAVRSGDVVTVVATFRNMADTIRTIHFAGVHLRNTQTGILFHHPGSADETEKKDIPPNEDIRISKEVFVTLSASAPPGSYQFYVMYSVREGPDGPIPVRMISDFNEIVIMN